MSLEHEDRKGRDAPPPTRKEKKEKKDAENEIEAGDTMSVPHLALGMAVIEGRAAKAIPALAAMALLP